MFGRNKKTQRIILAVIAGLMVLAMIIQLIAGLAG